MTCRSLLFVPGHRPDRFAKALASGADLVCVDWEDAVPPAAKPAARQGTLAWLAELGRGGDRPALERLCVRVNGAGTAAGDEDLAALGAAPAAPAAPRWLMAPKVEEPAQLAALAAALPVAALIALIESPRGVLGAERIAVASDRLRALMFGAADFAAVTGCAMTFPALLAARGQLALAAHSAGLELIDVPWLDIKDERGLREEATAVRDLGFTGKAAIHPAQVAVLQEVFTPSPAAVTWAREVVAAVGGDERQTAVVQGRFVDRPLILRAKRVLAAAGGSGTN